MKVSFLHRTMERSSLTSVFRPLLRDLSLVIVLLTLGLLDEYLVSVDRIVSRRR
jgi:hypothetical protein